MIETKDCSCPLCGCTDSTYFGEFEAIGRTCHKCADCGLYFIMPHCSWIPSVTDGVNPDAFEFWGKQEAAEPFFRWRRAENERVAGTVLGAGRLGKVLEIGFGEGPLTEHFVNNCDEYWGIEPIPASFERCVEAFGLSRSRAFNRTTGNMMEEPALQSARGTFDTIILVSVFEHLELPKQVLTDCHALLKDGGRLILSTPDSTFFKYLYLIRRLLRMEPWSRDHISFFTPANLQLATNRCGFETQSVSFHSLVTPDSAKYFGNEMNSKLVEFVMNCGRVCGVDRLLRIATIFLTLSKRKTAPRAPELTG